MRVCVFQGTFNPVHNAHLQMARYVSETFKFDRILFIPAFNPPHKECKSASSYDRFKMLKLALEKDENFELSDIEYKREGVSYTYLTICELYKIYNIDDKINFIIGTDAFEKIEEWYESDNLKKLVKFIVFTRAKSVDENRFTDLKLKGYDFIFADMNFFDISSTEIREKVAKGEKISNLVPEKVEEYIYDNGLYKN